MTERVLDREHSLCYRERNIVLGDSSAESVYLSEIVGGTSVRQVRISEGNVLILSSCNDLISPRG